MEDIEESHKLSLKAEPNIYQELIQKSFELRVTVFGSFCVAARINSQKYSSSSLDWRKLNGEELDMGSFTLPNEIKEKCIKITTKLGLVFGCIDLIVDDKGRYVFLEINEMGQFLWIEDIVPEIKMVDIMSSFLIHGDGSFCEKNVKPYGFSLDEILNSSEFKRYENQDMKLKKQITDYATISEKQ